VHEAKDPILRLPVHVAMGGRADAKNNHTQSERALHGMIRTLRKGYFQQAPKSRARMIGWSYKNLNREVKIRVAHLGGFTDSCQSHNLQSRQIG